VGTHALVQEGVTFDDLAVAVIDEQHRFGVAQREALDAKGRSPHVLLMTATPIPQTLARIVHADLDVSTCARLPPAVSASSPVSARRRSCSPSMVTRGAGRGRSWRASWTPAIARSSWCRSWRTTRRPARPP
jgi:ATP-dependent DNA helicase RecG